MIDGAAVRVSLICFSRAGDESVSGARLDGQPVDEIYSDLTARRGRAGVDLTGVGRLPENVGVAFMGDTKGGPFDIGGDQAREWLGLPANPNGRTNADVLKPWVKGMDLTRRSAGKWIVDFGWRMSAGDAALYEEPFRWVKEPVHPTRQRNRREAYRGVLVAARGAAAGHVGSAQRPVALHHDTDSCEAPTVRLVRHAHLSGPSADRHRPRRRHDLRDPAQPVPRALVAPAVYVAR